MNPLNFVAVILKVLLVNLLAALNFANVFLNKNVWKIKNVKKHKNVTKIKNVKNVFFYIYGIHIIILKINLKQGIGGLYTTSFRTLNIK